MGKGRQGRSVRRNRAAMRGDPRRSMTGKSKPHGTRSERRQAKLAEKREIELLKANAHKEGEAKKLVTEPHSFVIHRGKVGRYVRRLERDLRAVMEPFTATKLKELKRNNLKDFLVNGSVLGVTHLMVLTRSEQSLTMRIIRSPQGPTLSFRILSYTLSRDVKSAQRRALHYQQQFATAPLVVMNGLANCPQKHIQLMQSMFQNMFPSINVDKMKLSQVRRCVMISYDAENDTVDLRHYAIKAVPTGLSKSAKKLVQGKVPDLSKYKDISDFFLNPGQQSESEFEGEQKEVELAEDLTSRGCKAGQRTNIRLIELGPRVTMTLTKVEEGIDEGEVLYHSYIKKTPQELVELRKNLSKKKKMKDRRRKEIEHRVIRRLKAISERKQEEEDALKEERQKIINKQRAVTGEDDDARDAQRERVRAERKLHRGGGEGQNEPTEPPIKTARKSLKERSSKIGRTSSGQEHTRRKLTKKRMAE